VMDGLLGIHPRVCIHVTVKAQRTRGLSQHMRATGAVEHELGHLLCSSLGSPFDTEWVLLLSRAFGGQSAHDTVRQPLPNAFLEVLHPTGLCPEDAR
jgi:hypothetical protein